MALAEVALVPDPRELLARARQRTRPVVLAGEQTLPVLDALAMLLPDGLRRGSTVAVAGGGGATTLCLALASAASAAGSWVAVVGTARVGLRAAVEVGIAAERLLIVPEVPPASWSTVVAALVDAVDLVLVAGPRAMPAGDTRRLTARARERGAVLVPLPVAGRSPWREGVDVRLTVGPSTWVGPNGGGAGHLAGRRVEVVSGGRGAAARARRATLWLPGPDGSVG